MTSQYYALLADPQRERVLMTPTESGWTLPRLPITEDFWWQEVGPVNDAARTLLGWPVATLQCVHISGQEGEASAQLVYALEPCAGEGAVPQGMLWAPAVELNSRAPEHNILIQNWLAQTQPTVPWYRPGWRADARRWAATRLAERGHVLTAEPEQVRAWERSALWRFDTSNGKVYFKAVTPTFAYEPRLTQALGDWHPGWFPPVLARDEERRWMLLGDAGPHTGQTQKSLGQWEAGLRAYAEMQVTLASRVNDLLALGVPDRRLNVLRDHIESLLADTAALKHSPAGLSDDEIAALRAHRPLVLRACDQLSACPIPASLEHGDFAPGQIVYGVDGRYRFIDWSDSSVSFPFFGAQFFWEELQGELPAPAEARIRLRDAYLQPWTGHAPLSNLMEIFQAAMVVAPFYYASIYHRQILPTMTFKWEMERMLPYYLRIALRD